MKVKGPWLPSMAHPPTPTTITPMLTHPYRALPPGTQWNPHCGKRARQRWLRQQARNERNRLRKQYGSTSITGRDAETNALLLDLPAPTRIPETPDGD